MKQTPRRTVSVEALIRFGVDPRGGQAAMPKQKTPIFERRRVPVSIQRSLKNAMLTAEGLVSWSNNTPMQYAGKQRQYFSPETRTFTNMVARYSADFVEAQVQGLDPENPFDWQTRSLRMADIVRPSAAILRRADNYKIVLFADRDIEYVMPGSKIVTMGSTWIVTNPFNISGSDGAAIVQRCNAVWNFLDWYGNVRSEPMVVTNYRADANDSDAQEANLITKGYFNVSMQYNDVTRQIDTNTRFILGTAAYRVTGYSDFMTEFTGDYDSVRLLEFTVRYEEPNLTIDDMERHVAGGKSFSWEIQISGDTDLDATFPSGELYPGLELYPHSADTAKLNAVSFRNGEAVYDTEEHPISYLWSSSDESVVTVDESGTVTAQGIGEAVVTAVLAQDPSYSAEIAVSVGGEGKTGVRFTVLPPDTLAAYEECEIRAAFYQNGKETDEELEWSFDGAPQDTWRAMTGPKGATVYGFGYAKTPLTVTARYGGYSSAVSIRLTGI